MSAEAWAAEIHAFIEFSSSSIVVDISPIFLRGVSHRDFGLYERHYWVCFAASFSGWVDCSICPAEVEYFDATFGFPLFSQTINYHLLELRRWYYHSLSLPVIKSTEIGVDTTDWTLAQLLVSPGELPRYMSSRGWIVLLTTCWFPSSLFPNTEIHAISVQSGSVQDRWLTDCSRGTFQLIGSIVAKVS